jgi:AcrR family transcriptional regulator
MKPVRRYQAELTRVAEDARTRRARARPSGRTKLQQEQKEETRERLLRAAQQVFDRHSYAAASVEDIIVTAGASRASFYRHFDSKWEIASALCAQVMPEAWQLWHELAGFGEPGDSVLKDWLRRRLALYHRHRSMFLMMREAVALEPAGAAAVVRTHDEVIHVLASGLNAFRKALARSAAGQLAHIRACLLLMQLDEFTYTLAVRGWDVNNEIAIDVMSAQIKAFITD